MDRDRRRGVERGGEVPGDPAGRGRREGDYVHPEVGFYLWGVAAVLPVAAVAAVTLAMICGLAGAAVLAT